MRPVQNAFTNGPEIQICPVKRLYQLLETQDCSGWGAIISSTSPVDMEKLKKLPYVFRQYADVDYECPGRSFSREDAAAFFGITLHAEKEILMMVVEKELRDTVLNAIYKEMGMAKKAQGIAFSLPVSEAVGLAGPDALKKSED